ncbi:MAG: 2-phospho-L-lactate guanylyltransferase [Nocardioidaceae bacterium]|nr:2-phospho-L-lactate guanylyltransferase [Nocardioidaceae bacterium]
MVTSFVVVVPVKPTTVGKSRLDVLGTQLRAQLAAAFALDAIATALDTTGVAAVVVSTNDPTVGGPAGAMGCLVVPDPGGLNDSLVAGAQVAQDRWSAAHPVALCADLPSVRPDELGAALALLPLDRPAIVADAAGTGTTTYAAPYGLFSPAFGPGSRARHLAAGAVEITGDLIGLRTDVDTPHDLDLALDLGVGPHTRSVLLHGH